MTLLWDMTASTYGRLSICRSSRKPISVLPLMAPRFMDELAIVRGTLLKSSTHGMGSGTTGTRRQCEVGFYLTNSNRMVSIHLAEQATKTSHLVIFRLVTSQV